MGQGREAQSSPAVWVEAMSCKSTRLAVRQLTADARWRGRCGAAVYYCQGSNLRQALSVWPVRIPGPLCQRMWPTNCVNKSICGQGGQDLGLPGNGRFAQHRKHEWLSHHHRLERTEKKGQTEQTDKIMLAHSSKAEKKNHRICLCTSITYLQ